MSSSRRLEAAADKDYSGDAEIAPLMQRVRDLLDATQNPATAAEQYRQFLEWFARNLEVDATLPEKLRLAEFYAIDRVADKQRLQQQETLLDDNLYEYDRVGGQVQVTLIPHSSVADSFPGIVTNRVPREIRPLMDVLPGSQDSLTFVYVNGVATAVDNAAATAQLFVNKLTPLQATGQFAKAKLTFKYNRSWHAEVSELLFPGYEACVARAAESYRKFPPLILLTQYGGADLSPAARYLIYHVRFSKCVGQFVISSGNALDLVQCLEQWLNTHLGLPLATLDPNVKFTAQTIAFYHVNRHKHVVLIPHSQGNLIVSNALGRVPSYQGAGLQENHCTAVVPLAPPVVKAAYAIDDQHLRGHTNYGDILDQILLDGGTTLSGWDKVVVANSQLLQDLESQPSWLHLKPLEKAIWGLRIHAIDVNYLNDPIGWNRTVSDMTLMYHACLPN